MFEKLKEYWLYIILWLIALWALAYAYVQTSNSQKWAEIESANLDAMTIAMSRSDKLKKNSTVAEDLLNANGWKTIWKYKVDNSKVSYVIWETYSDIFDNKRMLDISSDLSDIEEGQLRTVLIAQPAVSVNWDDTINTVNLNSDKSLTVWSNTISQENLDEVADELKWYNVWAIWFATFATEQEAKDFRDTYFSSYEVYEIWNTWNFIVLKEYTNWTWESNSWIEWKVATQSNLEWLWWTQNQEEQNNNCNEYLCLNSNWVTIEALSWTTCWEEYEFQWNTYYVACNKSDVKTKILTEWYQANRVVTTKLTDMSYLFSYDFDRDWNIWNILRNWHLCNTWPSMSWEECGMRQDMIDQWYEQSFPPRLQCDELAWEFNQDILNWDTSNVTNMEWMFLFNLNFNQPLTYWNVSNVTNMYMMFLWAEHFNWDVTTWNTENVEDMWYMFAYNNAFNQDLWNWNISNVTNLRWMLWSMQIYNNWWTNSIWNWDISNLTTQQICWMFRWTWRWYDRWIALWFWTQWNEIAWMLWTTLDILNWNSCMRW